MSLPQNPTVGPAVPSSGGGSRSGETDRLVTYLTDLEQAAEDILTDRQTIIDYDRKRNANREALRHLKKSEDKKTWMAMGNTFFKLEKPTAEDLIKKDQATLDKEINSLRDNLKIKMDRIRDIEGKPALKGFNLKPLSTEEIKAISQTFGGPNSPSNPL